ncbi:MAG: MFS transporter, partial [Janthinobacterium sp.]
MGNVVADAQLAASRALVGAGEAGYAPVSYTWISAAFPKRRRQLALGLFSSAQPIGMALGVALGGYVATHYGWRHALGIMALPGLLIALWLYRGQDYQTVSVREIAGKSPAEPALRGRLAVIAGTPSLVFAYLSAAMGTQQWV